jgi:hypothetical protein
VRLYKPLNIKAGEAWVASILLKHTVPCSKPLSIVLGYQINWRLLFFMPKGAETDRRSRRKFDLKKHVAMSAYPSVVTSQKPACFSLLYKQRQGSFTWVRCKNGYFFTY